MSKKQKKVLWPVLTVFLISAGAIILGHVGGGLAVNNAKDNRPSADSHIDSSSFGDSKPRKLATETAAAATEIGTTTVAGPVTSTEVVHGKMKAKTTTNKKKY